MIEKHGVVFEVLLNNPLFLRVPMKLLFLAFVIIFSFSVISCPNEQENYLLSGYEITYYPHKDTYNANEEIKIALDYEEAKKYYQIMTIELEGGEYEHIDEQDGFILSDESIIVHNGDSESNIINTKWTLDFDSWSEEKYAQELSLRIKKPGKYMIALSFMGLSRERNTYDTSCEIYKFTIE